MRRVATLFVLVAVLAAVGRGVRPAAAAKLSASITVAADDDVNLSPEDRTQIYEKMTEAWTFHQKDREKAWACTQTPSEQDELLAPLVVSRVRVEVQIVRRNFLQRLWGGDYDITVRLFVDGMR